ncbi:hypothetical protein BH23PLA1_BH23PLA1_40000 [soil metagenome]
MSPSNALWAGRTSDGFLVRIEGQGTLRESPALRAFALQALEQDAGNLVIDLSRCEYLDSTLLGCLVLLHKRYGIGSPPRFCIAAPEPLIHRLLGPNRLDTLLQSIEQAPGFVGEAVLLSSPAIEANDLGQHVMECHRLLAELGGPRQEAFARIADHLARELATPRPSPR